MPTVIHNHPAEDGCNMACEDTVVVIALTLEIDNYYDGEVIQTTVQALVPPPPLPPHTYAYEYEDWEQDQIFCHTGTGKEDGDSAYFVTVTASSRPDLIPVDTKYEFGT